MVEQDGQKLFANDSIYYLLDRRRPINYLHWLAPDGTHILFDGGPVDVAYALLATILTPQRSDAPSRLKIGTGQEFIDRYQHPNNWASPAFLKKLIGPNFKRRSPYRRGDARHHASLNDVNLQTL